MDFTREPIIETIITPKEGFKLVIRSSKGSGQEEYFVDAVEIVAFGNSLFFRSLERPKAFLVPVSDYEAVEVKEARAVLKNAGVDRSIKIAGGRETSIKVAREIEKEETSPQNGQEELPETESVPATEVKAETRGEKKKDRRRHYKKRKGREDEELKEENGVSTSANDQKNPGAQVNVENDKVQDEGVVVAPSLFSALLQPPPTLISETIKSYRQNDLFKGAFYLSENEQYKPHEKVQELLSEDDDEERHPLQSPTFEVEEDSSLNLFPHSDEVKTIDESEEKEAVGFHLFNHDSSLQSQENTRNEEMTSEGTEQEDFVKLPWEKEPSEDDLRRIREVFPDFLSHLAGTAENLSEDDSEDKNRPIPPSFE